MKLNMMKLAIITLSIILSTGCLSYYAKDASNMPAMKMVQRPQYPVWKPSVPHEGSLWTDERGISLYPDRRARKVGDIITIRIVEDPEAELKANTKTSRTSSLDASKLKILGYMKALAEKNHRLAQTPGTDDLMLGSLGLKFDGQGSSDRDGHVQAYITAMVVDVLPNGNLVISGSRQIRVNNETQFITVSGIIRPEDIGPTNEISSTYIANAKIIYSGTGPISDKQKPGWLGRMIDHVWPF